MTSHDELLDEPFYDLVAREVAAKSLKPGLWAKAYSEMKGNKDQALALYIDLRVKQLKREFVEELEAQRERARVEAEILEREAKLKEQREAQEREKDKIESLKKALNFVTFYCDNCGERISVGYAQVGKNCTCRHCGTRCVIPQYSAPPHRGTRYKAVRKRTYALRSEKKNAQRPDKMT